MKTKHTPDTKRLYEKMVEFWNYFSTLSPRRRAETLASLKRRAMSEKDRDTKEFLTEFVAALSDARYAN